jgi:hypothetical protein
MIEKRHFKSIKYHECCQDLIHARKYGFPEKSIFDKYKKYQLSRKIINLILTWYSDVKQKAKLKFFCKMVVYAQHITDNWDTIQNGEKMSFVEYKDFFVYRFDGTVFRWDGNTGFIDKAGRHIIKTFSGLNKLVTKILYATKPLNGFHYSYKRMSSLKVKSFGPKLNVLSLKAKK